MPLPQRHRQPRPQGLYDPGAEHDACGVGFVAQLHGERSHAVVRKGIEVLLNLEHRGACGCDPDSGDGAGVLIQIPDAFLRDWADTARLSLPEPGAYAVGMVFLDLDPAIGGRQAAHFERIVAKEGQRLIGWRDVPHNPGAIGRVAREGLPQIRQI
ncbi:MAG: hypothetical protein HKP27_00205, partial [Myxococcales bacterium]|nr:hypothetical protein [Myxococcales bacterium]